MWCCTYWLPLVEYTRGKWQCMATRGQGGTAVLLALVATIVGMASMAGAGWIRWYPKGVSQWCCVYLLPWAVCPGAKCLPVGAGATGGAQVVLQACVATIVDGTSMVAGGWPQLHPKDTHWWCYVCLLPWVVHPGPNWQPVASAGHTVHVGGAPRVILWPP